MPATTVNGLNKYSRVLTQTRSQVGSQAMLYGAGLSDEDMQKPQVGIASMGWEGNTCNMHLNDLAYAVKEGVQKADMVGLIFHTIGVSDGISMGTEGMKFSLLSRDVIADSIETVMRAQWYDANISLPGCDKNMPGVVMALSRVNRPSIVVYGGTIQPGFLGDQKLDIVSAFEAYGRWLAKEITEAELKEVLKNACPGAGACGGMYTANTMASAIETLGMSLPYSSSYPAVSEEKMDECRHAGTALRHLVENDIKPSDILTRKAFENAITVVMALGGSTNAVLHLIAMAKAADVPLTHRRFPGDFRPNAAAGGPEAERTVCDGRPFRSRRRPGSASFVAGRGAAARRLPDGDRADAGGKRGGPARPEGRPARHLPHQRPDQADGTPADSLWQPGHRGRGRQDHGQGGNAFLRPGQGLRFRGGHAGGHRRRTRSTTATWSSSATRVRRAVRACARCCPSRRPSWARDWASRSP